MLGQKSTYNCGHPSQALPRAPPHGDIGHLNMNRSNTGVPENRLALNPVAKNHVSSKTWRLCVTFSLRKPTWHADFGVLPHPTLNFWAASSALLA